MKVKNISKYYSNNFHLIIQILVIRYTILKTFTKRKKTMILLSIIIKKHQKNDERNYTNDHILKAMTVGSIGLVYRNKNQFDTALDLLDHS